MTRFFLPDPDLLSASGHGGIASIPVLFDRRYRILEAEHLYLLDRVLRAWPIRKERTYRPKEDPLAPTTVVALARRLHHFADWRHDRFKDSCDRLDDLTYDHVLDYEREQWVGQGHYEGRTISPKTASVRGDVATDFLLWAAHRGLRKEFLLTVRRRSATPWTGGGTKAATRRAKPASRATMKALSLIPSRAEIDAWLAAVNKQRGMPKYLVCRLMVTTGIRLMEAVALETDQWPSLDEIGRAHSAGSAEVDLLLMVTKNSKMRTVRVPLKLAATIAHWVRTQRQALEQAFVDRHGEDRRPTRLFLSDRPKNEGVPIQRHTVFDCFREVEPRPSDWHPHKARHAFACHFMTRELLARTDGTKPEFDRWISQGGMVAAENLRRLLGHESMDTTRIYLNHLRMNADIAVLQVEFQDRLDGAKRWA